MVSFARVSHRQEPPLPQEARLPRRPQGRAVPLPHESLARPELRGASPGGTRARSVPFTPSTWRRSRARTCGWWVRTGGTPWRGAASTAGGRGVAPGRLPGAFDGSGWSEGPDLLPRDGDVGWHPLVFEGRMVYLAAPGTGESGSRLLVFDGTQVREGIDRLPTFDDL